MGFNESIAEQIVDVRWEALEARLIAHKSMDVHE